MAIVILCGMEFKGQEKAKEFVRQSLKSFDPNSKLWMDLVKRHPSSDEKIGIGIKRFFVTPNPMSKQHLQLNIERLDGSVVDISWVSCVTSRGASAKQNLAKAMRESIAIDIKEFKDESFNKETSCVICNTHIKTKFEAQVDHILPFAEIVKKYLELNNNVHPTEFDDCNKTHTAIFKPEDADFKILWISFHKENMSLRILCAKCNVGRNRNIIHA